MTSVVCDSSHIGRSVIGTSSAGTLFAKHMPLVIFEYS